MPSLTNSSPYSTLRLPRSFEDDRSDPLETLDRIHDLENDADSDTTLASDSFLKPSSQPAQYETDSTRERRRRRLSNLLTWLRWSVIVLLQGMIIILLLPSSGVLEGGLKSLTSSFFSAKENKLWTLDKTETGGDVNGLYIPTSHIYTLLTPEEEKYVPSMEGEENRMEIRKNWDMLMPLGSGSVLIPEYTSYPLLGKPIVDDPIRSGPIFEASWTHALHCLYYTVDSYHQLVISNGTKFGFDGERNDYHAAHCFEYLRNQIMCMADMTLEGSESVLDATGKGQAHMCRNRDEAVKWIEGRRLDDIQSIVGPANAV